MNLVVDASVALSWCFDDEGGDFATGVLEALRTSEAVAPSLWPLEVSNGLLTAERRGRIDLAGCTRFMTLLRALPIVIDPVARQRAFGATYALGRKHTLTAYDAAYLELAVRLGVPLASLDVPLQKAAEVEGVALFTLAGPA